MAFSPVYPTGGEFARRKMEKRTLVCYDKSSRKPGGKERTVLQVIARHEFETASRFPAYFSADPIFHKGVLYYPYGINPVWCRKIGLDGTMEESCHAFPKEVPLALPYQWRLFLYKDHVLLSCGRSGGVFLDLDADMKEVALAPDHISCYGLKVEEGTPLFARKDAAGLPDDEAQADMYLYTVEFLARHGFRQYEISNFARTGRESRHNLKYWTLGEYAGFGPGAHSDFGGVRYAYERDLEGYIRSVKDHTPMLSENERIPDLDRDTEWVMLGLRTVRGLDPKEFERRFRRRFDCFLPFLAQCEKAGYAVREDTRWHLTPRGFLVSNRIIGGMLDALAEEKRRRAEAAARGDFRVKLD